MGDLEIPDSPKPAEKVTESKKSKKNVKSSSRAWKQHIARYKKQKFRMRLLTILIIIFLIIGISIGYFYFYQLDTDGDGIPDIEDEDDDNDGMPDWWESDYGLDPKDSSDADKDLDGDGLKNVKEFVFGTDPENTDTDGDGLLDLHELHEGTDPNDFDTDNDGMPDGWERDYELDPKDASDAGGDPDNDGLDVNLDGVINVNEQYTNLDEYRNGTNPKNNDTDEDGLLDGWEIYYRNDCTDLAVTIARYASPYYEYNFTFDPLKAGEAGQDIDVNTTWVLSPDGLNNFDEHRWGTDPTEPDTDADGLSDGDEIKYGTNPLFYDTDCDKLPDGWEIGYGGNNIGLDPLNNDTNNDGKSDRFEDIDDDDLDNFQEFLVGTSPVEPDSDGDGIPDGLDIEPLEPDPESDLDHDGLDNLQEFSYGTDPENPDTDSDGLGDGREILVGFYGEVIDGIYHTAPPAGKYYTSATNNDTDGDGLADGDEILNGWHGELINGVYHTAPNSGIYYTNASNPDTDRDGLLDDEELFGSFGFNTNASNPDTDLDNISDYAEIHEVYGYKTYPTLSDTDGDLFGDGDEINTDFYPFIDLNTTIFGCIESGPVDGTNPEIADTDGDGMDDGWEFYFGMISINDPEDMKLLARYDDEHNTNYIELLNTHPEIEHIWLVNPLNKADAEDDPDHDGYDSLGDGKIDSFDNFTNLEEYNYFLSIQDRHTDPLNWDTDGDGMSDGWEMEFSEWVGTPYRYVPDPLNPADGSEDPDDDGIEYYINGVRYTDDFTNLEEYLWGEDLDNDGIIDHGTTDPIRPDTNTNGENDFEEIWYGDEDKDGLVNGWEFIFNGTPLDDNGFIPRNPKPGEFDPYSNDSNSNGVKDSNEDPDGDGWPNIAEHGWMESDLKTAPGGSDPTDLESYPGNISNRSKRSGMIICNTLETNENTGRDLSCNQLEATSDSKIYKLAWRYY